ncbi:ORF4 [Simian torque teno virus 33]|uniref:ORF4 n=1 Tax=Simian torque teno virus 33 TaxID=1629656 RepID=UPI0005D8A49A|nr:ORF4 [Simian torque teno virus 33]AJP36577.1 ORF4 [Simian torque teno virus 33]
MDFGGGGLGGEIPGDGVRPLDEQRGGRRGGGGSLGVGEPAAETPAAAAAGTPTPRPTPPQAPRAERAAGPAQGPDAARLLSPGKGRGQPAPRPPAPVIHRGVQESSLLFPETRRGISGFGAYSEFALQTEREVAQVFRRYPRRQPRPGDVPFYPYLSYQHPNCRESPGRYTVTFRLGFNPFSIN